MAASDLGLRLGFSDVSSCSTNSDLIFKKLGGEHTPTLDLCLRAKAKEVRFPRRVVAHMF